VKLWEPTYSQTLYQHKIDRQRVKTQRVRQSGGYGGWCLELRLFGVETLEAVADLGMLGWGGNFGLEEFGELSCLHTFLSTQEKLINNHIL